MKLDESMRERLQDLAASEACGLEDATRARIVRVALSEHARRSQRTLDAWWAVPALSVLGLFVWLALPSSELVSPRTPTDTDLLPAPRAANRPSEVHSPATPERCAALGNPRFRDAGGGREALDVADYASFVSEASSKATLLSANACGIELHLARGSVFVHARQLRGTPLVVHTALADVEVRGTIFRVDLDDAGGEVSVSVDEGTVWVTRREPHEVVVLEAGQRVVLSRGTGTFRARLAANARRSIREALGLAWVSPVPHVIEPSVHDGARQATQATEGEQPETRVWREGSLPMPQIAPEPGSSMTEDGRPMKKPQLIQGDKP